MGNGAVTPCSVAISAARLHRILATLSFLGVKLFDDKLSNLRFVASVLEKFDIIDGYGDAKEVKGERGRT